jgi:hypothetical protein
MEDSVENDQASIGSVDLFLMLRHENDFQSHGKLVYLLIIVLVDNLCLVSPFFLSFPITFGSFWHGDMLCAVTCLPVAERTQFLVDRWRWIRIARLQTNNPTLWCPTFIISKNKNTESKSKQQSINHNNKNTQTTINRKFRSIGFHCRG